MKLYILVEHSIVYILILFTIFFETLKYHFQILVKKYYV
jgi:hypothetical protein